MSRNADAPASFAREQGPGGLEARLVAVTSHELVARAAAEDSAPMIEGYGSVSEQSTVIEGMFSDWTEEVAAGAWAKSIAEGDIRSMFNHDTNQLLGRTKSGTLRLSEDDNGLLYEIDVNPDDPMAMGVHARVARGDVDGSSVWFRVIRQEWTYPDESNELEMPHRRILEGQLMETGPVTFPAFAQTTSSARALAPVDAVLRAAGITSTGRRARLASDLIADPEGMEEELRQLLASAPELRAAVCTCHRRAADDAPNRAAPPTPEHVASFAARIALGDGRQAHYDAVARTRR
ncbi:MAG TPA: HK97 family phage prohead protease [Nocardioidaceae bacterium]|nr:HK97 family phage prohead protease [Nocardioidaceae bacterium]